MVREGREPLQAGRSPSRWCNETFDVLYTSIERNGAIAEIYALLSSQPVFPSRIRFFAHHISVGAKKTLRLADMAALEALGVDAAHYRERDYRRTQEIADAAYFLGFDGVIAPSARWNGLNLMLFAERIPPAGMQLVHSEVDAIDWTAWRRRRAEPQTG